MASQKSQFWQWRKCRGRDGWDPPQDIPADMAAEVLNMHFYEGGLGQKRGGSTSTGTLSALTGPLTQLASWVPGQSQTARELFAVDSSGTTKIGRMAAGATFSSLTLKDNVASNPSLVSFAGLNGKLFISYDSTVNRVQVFDPGYSTTEIRRSGMGTPAAPTEADTGSGTVAVTRYYRVAYTEQRSSVTVRRSELSPSVTSVPSGSGSGITVTKPAAINEGETHWELYVSVDDAVYYGPIATTVVGTSTYDDSTTDANMTAAVLGSTYDLAPTEGTNKPFPSVKYLYSDGNRLFGLGVWETAAGDSHTPQAGTMYFTPSLDSSSIHDEERCQDTTSAVGRLLLSRNSGGVDRGISALGNVIVAFQDRSVFGLVPTGAAAVPFRRVQYSDTLGALSHWSIIQADDEAGRPAIYFLDPIKGPFRFGHDGFRWCGKDVADIWATVNPSATVVAHGVYHQTKQQIWWWLATGAATVPDTMIVLDVPEQRVDEEGNLRGGWSKWTGDLAACRASAMMANTLGATMSLDLKPYAADGDSLLMLKADTSDTDDNGTNFQGLITSGGMTIDPMAFNASLVRSYLLATAQTGVTITQTVIRNLGDEATDRTATVLLTPSANGETHVLKKFEATGMEDAFLAQISLGDASASDATWTFERWLGEVQSREIR